jgi:hypothetical protein
MTEQELKWRRFLEIVPSLAEDEAGLLSMAEIIGLEIGAFYLKRQRAVSKMEGRKPEVEGGKLTPANLGQLSEAALHLTEVAQRLLADCGYARDT